MEQIIRQFALANEVGGPEPVRTGFINDSYILPALSKGGVSYFLQRINHHIFENVEGLQQNILKVTGHIRQKLIAAGETDVERKVLHLIPTRDGKLFYRTPESDCWRVYRLIENALSMDKVTPESAGLAGEAFGRFQCQLSDLPFSELCETIPNFHNMEFRLEQFHEALRDNRANRAATADCPEIIREITCREEEMCMAERLFRDGKLPKRINHCDTKVNNMLFDSDGKPLCIVDLDTVMPGYVLSDFGDFMRTAANTGAEDDPDLDRIGVNMEVFTAYSRGYLREAGFLTPIEKGLLPFGCRLLSYMQAVRFFTDYLNGDTYYKIQYPEHNIVRTRAQLRLLFEQEKMREAMETVIRSL